MLKLVACLALCIGFAEGHASAQGQGTPPPLAQVLQGEAKAEYEAARQLVDDNDYTGALAKFRHVHELSRDARLLWNMAACEKELRHYARTASLIEQYLQQSGASLPADSRRNANDTRLALRRLYSPVTLRNTTAEARISVDGVAVERTQPNGPISVDLGTHQLRVEQAGLKTFETQLDVPGGKELRIDVPAEKEEAPARVPDPRLTITTGGQQETIAVDGKVLASGHWQGSVAPGAHVVRVTGADKKPFEAQLDL
ncbi:MAG: PEGA domain-containing protein, partial [Polyangiaceae bacterium]